MSASQTERKSETLEETRARVDELTARVDKMAAILYRGVSGQKRELEQHLGCGSRNK